MPPEDHNRLEPGNAQRAPGPEPSPPRAQRAGHELAAVVVEHQRADLTRLLLDSLRGQCEIILVRTSAPLEPAPPDVFAVIERPDNPGYAEAANEGLRLAIKSGFQFFLVANNDLIFEPDAIASLTRAFARHPMVGAVSPVVTFYPAIDRLWFAGASLHGDMLIPFHRSYMGKVGVYPPLAESDFLSGCAFCVRKEVLDGAGLIPEGYFMYFEDVEWSIRIRRCGWQLGVIGNAVVHHWASASSGGLRGRAPSPLSARMMARNPWRVRRRLGLGPSFLLGQLAVRLPYYVLVGLVSGSPSASLAYVKGLLEGLQC